MKKMFIVCPFPHDVQAGQRLKYEQHLKFFYLNGYSITLSSFISKNTWNIIYKKGYYFRKSLAIRIFIKIIRIILFKKI